MESFVILRIFFSKPRIFMVMGVKWSGHIKEVKGVETITRTIT